jgi:hypothetical protein
VPRALARQGEVALFARTQPKIVRKAPCDYTDNTSVQLHVRNHYKAKPACNAVEIITCLPVFSDVP